MINNHPKVRLLVLSGPSGVGKDSIAAALFDLLPNAALSISCTTRKPRPKSDGTMEQDGIDYFFLDRTEFLSKKCLETTEYLGEFYGTSLESIQELEQEGYDYVILNLDDSGVEQLKSIVPDAISILLLPTSEKALRHRLLSRRSETTSQINERMKKSRSQLEHIRLDHYDQIIINDDLIKTAQTIANKLSDASYKQSLDDKQAKVSFVYSTFSK